MRSTLIACLATVLAGGCVDTGYTVGASVSYNEGYYAPDLVTIQPGVQVIADYDYPVFYSSGAYWRFDNGYWYRSPRYTDGWGYVSRPPAPIARINRPYAYTHYRPYHYVARSHPLPQRSHTITPGHYGGRHY